MDAVTALAPPSRLQQHLLPGMIYERELRTAVVVVIC